VLLFFITEVTSAQIGLSPPKSDWLKPKLGFNQSDSVHAFPNRVLTTQISVAHSQTGMGQNHFQRAFPNWESSTFLPIDVNPIKDAFNSHVALRTLIAFQCAKSYYVLINVISIRIENQTSELKINYLRVARSNIYHS